jgi:hypothetical protein
MNMYECMYSRSVVDAKGIDETLQRNTRHEYQLEIWISCECFTRRVLRCSIATRSITIWRTDPVTGVHYIAKSFFNTRFYTLYRLDSVLLCVL